ncbi:MAG: hypothetical protein C0625_01690 [Arcobacter sp.]|nr:MAG: hypothetical protein C0625_01690 [Arcobacter sp.]
MRIIEKIKLITNPFDIFLIKTGKVFEFKGKCYRTNMIFRVFYRFYYGGLFIVPLLYFLNNSFFDYNDFIFKIIESIIVLLFIEVFIIVFLPMEEVSCYDNLRK